MIAEPERRRTPGAAYFAELLERVPPLETDGGSPFGWDETEINDLEENRS